MLKPSGSCMHIQAHLALFGQSQKSSNFFLGGDPPFKSAAVAASGRQVRTLESSRPLSRPPWVGSTWSMVWNADYRTARSSQTRPADSGTFFLCPMPELFLYVFRRIFRKFPKIMSTPLTRRFFGHFQDFCVISWKYPKFRRVNGVDMILGNFLEVPRNTCRKNPEWGTEKRSGICRPGWGSRAKFGSALIFKWATSQVLAQP